MAREERNILWEEHAGGSERVEELVVEIRVGALMIEEQTSAPLRWARIAS